MNINRKVFDLLSQRKPCTLGVAIFILWGWFSPPLYAGTGYDSRGVKVSVPDHNVRIVSLSPGATETLYAMGLMDEIVGVSDYCDYPPDFVVTKPKMGGFSTPNLEKIQAASPHVVILTTVIPLHIARQFDNLGIQFFVSVPRSFNELLTTVEQYGRLFNHEEEAYLLVQKLKADAGSIGQAIRNKSVRRVRTFIEIFDNPLYAAGRKSLPGDIVTMAGGEIVPITDSEYLRLNEERLLELNPEAIILGHNTDFEQFIESHRNISSISAVRNKKILVPDPDEFLRPGPRVIRALREIAEFLHPEAF